MHISVRDWATQETESSAQNNCKIQKRGCEITASTEKEDFSFKMNERSSFMLKLTCDENFNYKFPSLTVKKSKNRCIPYGYWAAAIFAVVADYSILFFPFTFFLNISHFTFCYELIICSETTDVMKIIRNSFSFV